MKKIFAITFILLIGLMVFGGCTSTTVEPSNQPNNQQKTTTDPQQNQQQAESDAIPQPPALPEE